MRRNKCFFSIILVLAMLLSGVGIKTKTFAAATFTNVSISSKGILSWDPVADAGNYYVDIGEGDITLSSTVLSYDLKAYCDSKYERSGSFTVKLRAYGSNGGAPLAQWSGSYSYSSPYPAIGEIKDFTFGEEYLTWTSVTCNGQEVPDVEYEVFATVSENGNMLAWSRRITNEPKLDIYEFIKVGTYEYGFSVVARAPGYQRSEYLIETGCVRAFNPAAITNLKIDEDGIATWDDFPGAKQYTVKVKDPDENIVLSTSTEKTSYNVNKRLYEESVENDTTYTVEVTAVKKMTYGILTPISVTASEEFYFAWEYAPLWVNGVQQTSLSDPIVLDHRYFGYGYAEYDYKTNTILLRDLDVLGELALWTARGYDGREDALDTVLFYSTKDLTIKGTGTLFSKQEIFASEGKLIFASGSKITGESFSLPIRGKQVVFNGKEMDILSSGKNSGCEASAGISISSSNQTFVIETTSGYSALHITSGTGKITMNGMHIATPASGTLGNDSKNVYQKDGKTVASKVKLVKATPTPTKKPATPTPTKKPATPTPTNTPKPTNTPTKKPTNTPTKKPTNTPTKKPTNTPTKKPTNTPTKKPTNTPTKKPTNTPTKKPTNTPTKKPTNTPTKKPTATATPTIKVSAPSNVTAKASSPTTVDISWTPAPNTDFVQVWRTHKPNAEQSDYVLLGTYYASDGKSVSKSLTPNKTYYYKLRSYKKLSNGTNVYSGYSTVVSATPKVDVPTGLKVTATTSNSISLNWNKVNGTSIFYEVWRLDDPNNMPGACLGRYKETSKVSTNLKSGTTYYYRVRAYYYYKDADGTEHRIYGGYSPIVSAKTK